MCPVWYRTATYQTEYLCVAADNLPAYLPEHELLLHTVVKYDLQVAVEQVTHGCHAKFQVTSGVHTVENGRGTDSTPSYEEGDHMYLRQEEGQETDNSDLWKLRRCAD